MGLDVIISELFSLIFSLQGFCLVLAIVLYKVLTKFIRNLVWKYRKSKYPKDVVVLHQFPKGYQIPSMSPFALKLETWLRMTDIKYQNSFGYTFGPKGKIPFITYNGEDVPDSQFCIEYLSKKMNKDLSKDHAPKDLGVARAFSKMAEESIFWMSGFSRFVYEPNSKYLGMHPAIVWYLARAYKKRGKVQGYGLHSKDELYSIGKKDLKALNEFLTGKKFLLGEKPCNEDASIFGIVAQIVYTDSGSMNTFVKKECPNVLEYIENIKRTYWPDWDECIGRKKNKKSE